MRLSPPTPRYKTLGARRDDTAGHGGVNVRPQSRWEIRNEPVGGASVLRILVRYGNDNREHPEVIGVASFATGTGAASELSLSVRGRYGNTWGPW